MINIDYLWGIIEEIETKERNAIKPYETSLSHKGDYASLVHEARAAERMKAWEKLLYWSLDGVKVS